MFLRILKKDLKRKRAMNIILLVFIILSSLFVASSVNNIYCVTNALDNFLEISNAPDYFAAIRGKDSIETITDKISDVSEITYSGYERMIFAEKSNFSIDGEDIDFKNSSIIMSFGDAKTKYFDMDNEEITDVKEGTVVLSGKAVEKVDIEIGDIITVKIGDKSLDLKVADSCKDAVLGSDLMGMTRFIMNEKDFEYFYDNDDDSVLYGSLWYINSTDTNKLNSIFSEINNVLFNADRSTIKMAYVLDMVIAGVFLVISVCLILVAFVVLKFTITFTLSEEFREIGVMKAIGIKNTKIRCLYLVKYLAMAVAGSTVGFFLSIPFSDTLLKNV
ncbi:MAG: ABC transporter permease [Oscillospiraceae bacterium]|nr:ABC transporter permease [Oscillospiraceae bacterium]